MMSLPEDLSYLRAIAFHYGPAWRFWSAPADGSRIERHTRAWSDLAQGHQAICKGEDIVAITHWLRSPAASPRHREERRMVRGLLRLYERLGECGVKPFDQPILRAPKRALVAALKSARNDTAWELPARFHYIIDRARRLGIRPDWDALGSYIDRIHERQFNALVATADLMRRRGDDHQLRRWLIESHSSPEAAPSPHAALVRGLLHVLDALDIF